MYNCIPLGVRTDEAREKETEGWGVTETREGREENKIKNLGPVPGHTAARSSTSWAAHSRCHAMVLDIFGGRPDAHPPPGGRRWLLRSRAAGSESPVPCSSPNMADGSRLRPPGERGDSSAPSRTTATPPRPRSTAASLPSHLFFFCSSTTASGSHWRSPLLPAARSPQHRDPQMYNCILCLFPSATPLSVRCSSDPALAPPLDVFSMDPEDTISRPQSTVSEHTPHTDAWQECLSSFLFSVVTVNEVQICIVLLEEAVLLSSWSFDVFNLSLFAGFDTKQSTFMVILYLCLRLTFYLCHRSYLTLFNDCFHQQSFYSRYLSFILCVWGHLLNSSLLLSHLDGIYNAT